MQWKKLLKEIVLGIIIAVVVIYVIVFLFFHFWMSRPHDCHFISDTARTQATLNTLATACETYAQMHGGMYPQSVDDLLSANPPFIIENYCAVPGKHFEIICTFREDGYVFNSVPVNDQHRHTEAKSYSITKGGELLTH